MVRGTTLYTAAARSRVVRLIVVIAASLMLARTAAAGEAPTRAAWIPPASLETPDAIRRAVNAAVSAGVQTLIAPAPIYPDAVSDGFGELLRQAREHHLKVFASIDVGRVALAGDVPAARDHVLYQHPDWLMVPRALAPEILRLDVRSPEYVGRLARWTRTNGVDGVYVSPLLNEAASFIAAAAASVLSRYAVDGVQLDAARYPADDFDYGRRAIDTFRQEIRVSLSAAERARMDGIEALDPFAYANEFPDQWRRFRQERLTTLVARVRTAIRETRPAAIVTALVSGAADSDLRDHLQDWRGWLEQHLVDAVSVRSGTITTIVSDVNSPAGLVSAAASSGSR